MNQFPPNLYYESQGNKQHKNVLFVWFFCLVFLLRKKFFFGRHGAACLFGSRFIVGSVFWKIVWSFSVTASIIFIKWVVFLGHTFYQSCPTTIWFLSSFDSFRLHAYLSSAPLLESTICYLAIVSSSSKTIESWS